MELNMRKGRDIIRFSHATDDIYIDLDAFMESSLMFLF